MKSANDLNTMQDDNSPSLKERSNSINNKMEEILNGMPNLSVYYFHF